MVGGYWGSGWVGEVHSLPRVCWVAVAWSVCKSRPVPRVLGGVDAAVAAWHVLLAWLGWCAMPQLVGLVCCC